MNRNTVLIFGLLLVIANGIASHQFNYLWTLGVQNVQNPVDTPSTAAPPPLSGDPANPNGPTSTNPNADPNGPTGGMPVPPMIGGST